MFINQFISTVSIKNLLAYTNKKGIEFFTQYQSFFKIENEEYINVVFGHSNWFYVIISENNVIALPYNKTSCDASTFGNKLHLNKVYQEYNSNPAYSKIMNNIKLNKFFYLHTNIF